jgi:methionine sulfoxide reductase heme-binding subunit
MLAVTEKLSWYITRSSGIVAWVLATASILWGFTLSSRLVRKRGVPAWLLALHRYLSTLAIVFTVIHMLGLIADNYVYFGWKELLIPMATTWRPGPTAWGIVAFYILVAVEITSLLMRKLPRKVWHTIHLTSIFMFVAGTIHGFQSGADRDNRLMQWGAMTGIVMVLSLMLFRILTLDENGSRKRKKARAAAAKAAKRGAIAGDAEHLTAR